MGKITRTIQEVRTDLAEALAKLKEVQDKGDRAIDQHDLDMGYDAHFYLNCPDWGQGMLYAHIDYYEEELEKMTAGGEQTALL